MFDKIFTFTQEKLNNIYENSLILQNIDKLIFISIISIFITSTFLSSDVIGFIALITIFLTIIKLSVKKGASIEAHVFDLWLLAYFMIVVMSLFGSTLFYMSLKGFLKTAVYLGFYVSMANYLKDNRHHIPYIFGTIGFCLGFESITGLLQNSAGTVSIATWQDISQLNPEQIMTRVYGTLKPFNPNLLGGYFVAGIPALFAMCAYFIYEKKYLYSSIWFVLALLSIIVLFLTGCRGAYIGMMIILAGIFAVSAKYLWQNYKKIYWSIIGICISLMTSVIICISSLRARIFSIFAMRQDSSNSFRFNVYHSAVNMFKDNWLLGIGTGNQNFREIYGLYMKTGFDALSAYNIFLEIAVESGILALIAFLGFLIILIKRAVEFIINSYDAIQVIFVSCALISIFALITHGLVDTVFFRPQIQFIFWTMAAVAAVKTDSLSK